MALDILNIKPHVVSRSLEGYITMVYGEPKTGKTTLATRFPKHLIMGFEKGWNALPGAMAAPMDKWSDFIQIINQLKKPEAKDIYSNIIIDTVDIAYNLCEQHVCQVMGVDSIEKIQWGKGYKMVEEEFDKKMRSIIQMGYGLIFISHSELKNVTENGVEFEKAVPSLNKRGVKVIKRMSDIICYVKPITERDGTTGEEKTRSFGFLRGKSTFEAGCRFKYMPEYIEFNYKNLVDAMHNAIDKEAAENDNKLVRDEVSNLYQQDNTTASTKTFEDVIAEFNTLTSSIMQKNGVASTITEIIENYLGKGKYVQECTQEQKSIIELINEGLSEYLGTLTE